MWHTLVMVIAVVAMVGPPRSGVPRTSAAGSAPPRQASPAGMPAALVPVGTGGPATGGSWSNVAAVSLASLGGALVLRRQRRR
jgi:MYXO-CTERM domain-containing protein